MSKLHEYLGSLTELTKDFTVEEYAVSNKSQKSYLIICGKNYNNTPNYQSMYVRIPNDKSKQAKLQLFISVLIRMSINYIKFNGSVINLVWEGNLTESTVQRDDKGRIEYTEYQILFKYTEVQYGTT